MSDTSMPDALTPDASMPDTTMPMPDEPTEPRPRQAQRSDLDISALQGALARRTIGSRIYHYDAIGSTMDEARRLAAAGAPEGAVVIAEEQTAGRGRFQRAWVSPRGENLSFSVILMPRASQLPYMNMAATLAVARTVAEVADAAGTPLQPSIKWPNDVRVGGLKISGILIETAIAQDDAVTAIVGIGLNVNFDPSLYPEIADISTSLYRETGERRNRTPTLRALLAHFDDAYAVVRGGGSLAPDWAALLDTTGQHVRLRWQDAIIEGVAEGVDEQGNLLVRRADGSLYIAAAGEVTSQT